MYIYNLTVVSKSPVPYIMPVSCLSYVCCMSILCLSYACLTPIWYLSYTYLMPVLYLSYTCLIPVLCLSYTCLITVLCLSYTCLIPVLYLSYACLIPVLCLSYTCLMPVLLWWSYGGLVVVSCIHPWWCSSDAVALVCDTHMHRLAVRGTAKWPSTTSALQVKYITAYICHRPIYIPTVLMYWSTELRYCISTFIVFDEQRTLVFYCTSLYPRYIWTRGYSCTGGCSWLRTNLMYWCMMYWLQSVFRVVLNTYSLSAQYRLDVNFLV
jgi:hypothetical protein